MNVTWLKRKNEFELFSTWDSGSPDFSGRIGVRYEKTLQNNVGVQLDLFGRGETDSLEQQPSNRGSILESSNDSWFTWNLSGGIDFGERTRYRLAFEARNLLNTTYTPATENLLGPKRSVMARFSIEI